MSAADHRIAFGPVPSRRLGQSLGVNNIPAKACTFACVYCQVGPTTEKTVEPRPFFAPEEILRAVAGHLERVRAHGGRVDYLSFVPDGEPTLDSRLGESIDALATLGVPIAVITNATLLWRADVRDRLAKADLVSVKVDTVDAVAWRRVNLPHRALDLAVVLDGIRAFASAYRGVLITETMLLAGLNDGEDGLEATARFVASLSPRTAYLAVPTRPTTVAGVAAAGDAAIARAYAIFSRQLAHVEVLAGHETQAFAHTGDAREDVLGICAVHPMREQALRRLLAEDGADWTTVEGLLADGRLVRVEHAGESFFLRPVRRARAD